MHTAPKFGKVEILKYNGDGPNATDRLSFNDCGLMITGNYLVVIEDKREGLEETLMTTSWVYNLSQIKGYKTYTQ